MQNMPHFKGDPSTAMDHIEKLTKHASEVNMVHLNSLMELFIASIEYKHWGWPNSCEPERISSFNKLLNKFIDYKGPKFQSNEVACENLEEDLQREGLISQDEEVGDEPEDLSNE